MRYLFVLLLTLATAAPADDFAVVNVAPGSSLNVRKAPGTQSPITGKIPAGSLGIRKTGKDRQVFVEDGYEFWSPVAYGKLKGWVNGAYLAAQQGKDDETVTRRAVGALYALKECSSHGLAEIAHPLRGIRFGLTGGEFSDKDIVLLPGQIREAFASKRIHTWGGLQGPVRMSLQELCETALQPPAIIKKVETGFLCPAKGYEKAHVVSYYDATIMEGEEGGLKLIMEQHSDGQWYLAGLIPWSTI